MSGLVDRITAVLRQHKPTMRRIKHPWRDGILLNIAACTGCDWGDEDTTEDGHAAHVAERVAAELQLTKDVVATGVKPNGGNMYRVRWVSGWIAVEEKPSGCKHGCTSAAEHRAHGGTPQSRQIGGMP